LLICLDNCCHNRPFDEQVQVRVRLETIAKLTVQLMMAWALPRSRRTRWRDGRLFWYNLRRRMTA